MATDLPLRYSQNPRPVGLSVDLKLAGDRLVVDNIRKVEEVALGSVTELRLSYETSGLSGGFYKTRLRLKSGKTVAFTSQHWTSMIQSHDQGAAYSAFVQALAAAVAAASPNARFVAGKARLPWLVMALLAGAVLIGVALFAWQAFRTNALGAAALGAAVVGLGVWQLEPLLRLNRPRTFTSASLPRDLLPQGA